MTRPHALGKQRSEFTGAEIATRTHTRHFTKPMLCYVLENTQELCPPRVTWQEKKTLVRIIDGAIRNYGIGSATNRGRTGTKRAVWSIGCRSALAQHRPDDRPRPHRQIDGR